MTAETPDQQTAAPAHLIIVEKRHYYYQVFYGLFVSNCFCSDLTSV